MATKGKTLYRSQNKVLGGVCAGAAEYFNIDPLIARIIAILVTVAIPGLMAIAYVALWCILPQSPKVYGPLDVEPERVESYRADGGRKDSFRWKK